MYIEYIQYIIAKLIMNRSAQKNLTSIKVVKQCYYIKHGRRTYYRLIKDHIVYLIYYPLKKSLWLKCENVCLAIIPKLAPNPTVRTATKGIKVNANKITTTKEILKSLNLVFAFSIFSGF